VLKHLYTPCKRRNQLLDAKTVIVMMLSQIKVSIYDDKRDQVEDDHANRNAFSRCSKIWSDVASVKSNGSECQVRIAATVNHRIAIG
jgi:hypothetical protein